MTNSLGLSAEELEIFATGLFFVASRDGVDAQEESMLRDFLKETQCPLPYEQLAELGFCPLEAAQVLRTTHLRRVFLKSAIAMSRADGQINDAERRALGEIADAFQISHVEYGELESQAIAQIPLLA